MEFLLKTVILLITCLKLGLCQYDCTPTNRLPNNHLVLNDLRGYLYTLYTTVHYHDCEVFFFKRDKQQNHQILCRTTTDTGCCVELSLNATVQPEHYYKYVIETHSNCPIQLHEDAKMKLIAKQYINNERCLIFWTCRTSRSGVHAFCNTPKISPLMDGWIKMQYRIHNLNLVPVIQNCDYKGGQCFADFA